MSRWFARLALAVLLSLSLLVSTAPAADLTVTAATVAKGANAQIQIGTAGETLTAGQGVYIKASDGNVYKAKCSGTAAEVVFVGVALHGSLAGQPIAYQTAGTLNIGATVAVGTPYYVSATYGGICPFADLVSGNKVTLIGYASAASTLTLTPVQTAVSIP